MMSSFFIECSQPTSSVAVTWYPCDSSNRQRSTLVRWLPNSRAWIGCRQISESGVLPNDWFLYLFNMAATSAWQQGASTMNFACLRSEEHTSELQSQSNLVCRLLLEK